MDFTGAYEHYNERLKERFNLEIAYDDFLNKRVFKRTLKKKYIGKYVNYQFGDDMVHVYYVTKKYEYPITVYKLDRFNKGRILRVFD